LLSVTRSSTFRRLHILRLLAPSQVREPRAAWSASLSTRPPLSHRPDASVSAWFRSYENASNAKGERYVWLVPKVVEHLRALRGPERATAT
jgi:hypothetical protein